MNDAKSGIPLSNNTSGVKYCGHFCQDDFICEYKLYQQPKWMIYAMQGTVPLF